MKSMMAMGPKDIWWSEGDPQDVLTKLKWEQA